MSDTFESLLVDLSRAGVDYLVAGGVSVTPRRLCPRASTREKDRLDVAALQEIIAGTARPDPANLEELTPPASSIPSRVDFSTLLQRLSWTQPQGILILQETRAGRTTTDFTLLPRYDA